MSKKPTFKFKSDFSLEERKNESARILRDCPNRVPVIAEVAPDSKDMPILKKNKYDNKSISFSHKEKYKFNTRFSFIFNYKWNYSYWR